ncbi:MAG: class I SAM-dependent methyltransferase [Chthoniobacterales bacterium]|nr:class I SAM-dependent methyltransferase [Chthoniobacterales bacterium]
MTSSDGPPYLSPYLRAAKKYGSGFNSLLWARPDTQASRFDAFARATDLHRRTILDVGCGRADLFDFLRERRIEPLHYVGIEAVPALAEEAVKRVGASGMILRADFVAEPVKLFVGAERVVISGALNTMDNDTFFSSIRRAWEACAEILVFNFLSSASLAGLPYLTWHRVEDVVAFAKTLSPRVTVLDDYLDGDCTIAMRKVEVQG